MAQPLQNVTLRFACHENWDKMSAEEQGRFCSSCKTVVHDFTNSTQEDLLKVMQEKGGKVCGHFRSSQVVAVQSVSRWPRWLAAAMVLLGIKAFGGEAMAQSPEMMGKVKKVPQTGKPAKTSSDNALPEFGLLGEVAVPISPACLPKQPKHVAAPLDSAALFQPPVIEEEFTTSVTFTGIVAEVPSTDVVVVADKMPVHFLNEADLMKYLSAQITYPEEAITAKVQGKVFVSYIIEIDGRISDIRIEKGLGYGCDEEVLRMIQHIRYRKPAMQNGKPIRYRMVQPVKFVLPASDTVKSNKR